MEIVFKESGRSARIETRFHKRIVRVELTQASLTFFPTLLGVKCTELLSVPVGQIDSVRRVNERGIPSFEVNSQDRKKLCWFDTTIPEQWEQAFSSLGIVVEREPDEIPQKVGTDV